MFVFVLNLLYSYSKNQMDVHVHRVPITSSDLRAMASGRPACSHYNGHYLRYASLDNTWYVLNRRLGTIASSFGDVVHLSLFPFKLGDT